MNIMSDEEIVATTTIEAATEATEATESGFIHWRTEPNEAQRQREQQERRERLRDIATGVNHFDDCVVDGDSITFRAFGHRFVIREVE